MHPLVSVIIPTYNRADLLPRAIDSVLAQDYAHWELIVVDDGSTDSTKEVVAEIGSRCSRPILYLGADHRGPSAARNLGIERSRGDFVCFLDSDDAFAPSKIGRQVELFRLRPELGLVYSDYSIHDGESDPLRAFDSVCGLARRVPTGPVGNNLFTCRGSLFDTLIRGYFVATITGMVRRGVLGPDIRFDERLSYAEEWLFFLRVARRAPAGFVDEALSIHYPTPGSLTRTDCSSNSVRYLQTLKAIATTFSDLRPDQRRHLHAMMADTCRQIAFDATGRDEWGEAARSFLEALRLRPQARTLRELAGLLPAAASRRLSSLFGRPRCQEECDAAR